MQGIFQPDRISVNLNEKVTGSLVCVRVCADFCYFSVAVGHCWINHVDWVPSQFDKSRSDGKEVSWSCMPGRSRGLEEVSGIILKTRRSQFKSTHLYVICLCCHFCPVRAYRRFLTLNLDEPPIWSGTPHLGFFIHLQERDVNGHLAFNTHQRPSDAPLRRRLYIVHMMLFVFMQQTEETHKCTHT